jgi:hypothetical protein
MIKSYIKVLVLLFLPSITLAQIFQCDGTSLPEFYSIYGGSDQFTEHTNDAINTFIEAEDAVATGNYATAQSLINDLFSTYPRGGGMYSTTRMERIWEHPMPTMACAC